MRDILSFCIKFMIIVSDSILTEDKLKHKNADFSESHENGEILSISNGSTSKC